MRDSNNTLSAHSHTSHYTYPRYLPTRHTTHTHTGARSTTSTRYYLSCLDLVYGTALYSTCSKPPPHPTMHPTHTSSLCSKPPPTTSPHTVTRTAADCYYGRRHCYRGRRGEHRHEQMHARSATRETRLHGTRVPRACPSFETTVCHRAASENLHAKYLTCKPPPHPIMHPTHTSSLQQDRQPPRRRPIHCHSYCSRLLLYGHAVSTLTQPCSRPQPSRFVDAHLALPHRRNPQPSAS